MPKLIKILKSDKSKKKYLAVFKTDKGREKKTYFGSAEMDDYTITKDKEQRERYRKRHKKDLKTNDPTRAGYLSFGILWTKPNLKASILFYNKLLNKYNKDKDIEKFKKELLDA